jgi:hypothetical protein
MDEIFSRDHSMTVTLTDQEMAEAKMRSLTASVRGIERSLKASPRRAQTRLRVQLRTRLYGPLIEAVLSTRYRTRAVAATVVARGRAWTETESASGVCFSRQSDAVPGIYQWRAVGEYSHGLGC